MKKITRRGHGTLNELNITPLLDLVFVLLVIFIITTPQMVNNLEMALPSGQPPPPVNPDAPRPLIHRINVDERGQPSLDGNIVTAPELKAQLQRLKAADSELRVVVKGADEVDYQNMVAVLDVLQVLDITRVGLATEAGTPGR